MPSNTNIKFSNVHITEHAYKRSKQRLGWNTVTVDRMSKKAFEFGIKRRHTKGYLKKYLDDLFNRYELANNLRLYGETVFVFANNSLITVWHLPVELRSLAKVIRIKQYKDQAVA